MKSVPSAKPDNLLFHVKKEFDEPEENACCVQEKIEIPIYSDRRVVSLYERVQSDDDMETNKVKYKIFLLFCLIVN